MKAVGYVSGVYVDYEGNIVDNETQKKRIKEYAAQNGVELLTVFEDMDECADVMSRPGVKEMLSEESEADMVLVDRVWCLGRTRAAISPFMQALDSKGMKLEAGTDCFDVTSQFARFWYRKPGQLAHTTAAKARKLDRSTVATVAV
ncbi:MAG TPA: recombinase family protein [bacterium]|nr:recombinase family protein [bacterium]